MTKLSEGSIIALVMGICLVTLVVLGLYIGTIFNANHTERFVAAVDAGLEQQQREGSTYWLWAYPAEEE